MRLPWAAWMLVVLLLPGCSAPVEPDYPPWVSALIEGFKNAPVGNPPQSVWRYDYDGQTVYYVPPQCCDQFSILLDTHGNIICAPDGGLTGTGDGRCSDFFHRRTNGVLVWKDPRGS